MKEISFFIISLLSVNINANNTTMLLEDECVEIQNYFKTEKSNLPKSNSPQPLVTWSYKVRHSRVCEEN